MPGGLEIALQDPPRNTGFRRAFWHLADVRHVPHKGVLRVPESDSARGPPAHGGEAQKRYLFRHRSHKFRIKLAELAVRRITVLDRFTVAGQEADEKSQGPDGCCRQGTPDPLPIHGGPGEKVYGKDDQGRGRDHLERGTDGNF